MSSRRFISLFADFNYNQRRDTFYFIIDQATRYCTYQQVTDWDYKNPCQKWQFCELESESKIYVNWCKSLIDGQKKN